MLTTLRVRNLVTIEDLEVEFSDGLNVLTGETGAGKSILVDALALAAGERADASLVRAGCDRATVEAAFEVEDAPALAAFLEERGIDAAGGTAIVRRDVAASGTGRVLVNGSPATVGVLRELGERLLERHGQHEQRGLLAPERQLELLDAFGGNASALERVARAHAEAVAAEQRLARIEELSRSGMRRVEELTAALGEIRAVNPAPGESEALRRDRHVLQNASRVAELLDHALAALDGGADGAVARLAAAERRAGELSRIDPTLGPLAERLASARIEADDVRESLDAYRRDADFDPGRLEAIEARRAAIDRLLLKWGPEEVDVLRAAEAADRELRTLGNLEAETAAAEGDLRRAREAYLAAAATLTRARETARRLGAEVQRQLAPLALPKARLEVVLEPARGPEIAGPAGPVVFAAGGAERVELRLAANPGEPARPLARAASGGELSRVMLALHLVLEGAAAGRALVFDEIDAGVSGAVALAVGARLARLAARHQVLCVTHLPQVAAFAASHYHVAKRVEGGRTRTTVRRVDGEARVEALAGMLGGREAGVAARENAAELLAEAAAVGRGAR